MEVIPDCSSVDLKVATIVKEIAVAESTFDTFRASRRFYDKLHEIDSLEAMCDLLTDIGRLKSVHPCWYYLLVSKMMELMQTRGDADIRNAFDIISDNCQKKTLYPILGITANYMIQRGFLPDDPLQVRLRHGIPLSFTIDQKSSEGGIP